MTSITDRERQEIEAANASGDTPVVFIHGLWVLPSSWADWADFAALADDVYDYGGAWEENTDWLYYAYYYASEILTDDGVYGRIAEVEALAPSAVKTYFRGRLMQWQAHTYVAMILNYHAFQYKYFNP